MDTSIKRIAINFGGGYIPGLNAVIAGTVRTASELGWEVLGIRDGYDGFLFRGRYRDGGLIKLTPELVESLSGSDHSILGAAARSDPFNVREINGYNIVEEVDKSGELLETLNKEKIDAVISVVGSRALNILWKLHRKGLKTICIPVSVENDVAATMLSFGFNTSLSFVASILARAKQAAQSAGRIAVVEVLGEHSGWLALQAGMAVLADAVLIPEIPFDLQKVADKLKQKVNGRRSGLVVVAEGAKPGIAIKEKTVDSEIKAALSPGAAEYGGSYVIERSGRISSEVALEIQRLTDLETSPLVLGQLARGGTPTVTDIQLGLGYGAGAVRALNNQLYGTMVVFQPPDLKFVPLAQVINKYRTVPVESEFIKIAHSLGISLGN